VGAVGSPTRESIVVSFENHPGLRIWRRQDYRDMAVLPPDTAFESTPSLPENRAAEPLPYHLQMGIIPRVPEDSGRNALALVSLIASLFFPLGIGLNVFGVVARLNSLPLALSIISAIAAWLTGIVGIPALLCAIATGHVAWIRRKRYSRADSLGWMAILGLVIGYVSLAFLAGVIIIFILAVLQGG
jgi:hypothetical protein